MVNCQSLRRLEKKGEEIDRNYSEYKNKISFPLVTAAIRYVFAEENSVRILILIGTDQDVSVDERYRAKDTIGYACVIQKYFKGGFEGKKIEKTEVQKYCGVWPSGDEALEFFRQVLRKAKRFQRLDGEKVYLETSGGIPTLNLGLFIAATERYGEYLVPLWIAEGDNVARPVATATKILEQRRWELFEKSLQRYDYAAAANVAASDIIRNLCLYARARLDLDFTAAEQSLSACFSSANTATKNTLEKFRGDVRNLTDERTETCLTEVLFNAELKLERQEFSDFLIRVFRLQEGCFQLVLQRITGNPGICAVPFDNWTKFIDGNQGLREHLERSTRNGKELSYNEPNVEAMKAVCDYYCKNPGLQNTVKDLPEVLRLLNGYDKLRGLRNKSMLVHGTGGISREEITEKCGGSPLAGLREVFASLGLSTDNHFHELNRFLLELRE